jgi:hypothetical protein
MDATLDRPRVFWHKFVVSATAVKPIRGEPHRAVAFIRGAATERTGGRNVPRLAK